MSRQAFLIAVGYLVAVGSTSAQDRSKYYTNQHPEKFAPLDWIAFYDAIDAGTAKARKELPHHLDLAFGKDPKQKLDLYLPEEPPDGAATFLFLHGGGFREGDRAHYGYVALPFAKHGIITAVASYRLTDEGTHFPAQPEDVANAVAWIHENISSFGGNPELIYVGGHSAGAILSAFVGVRGEWRKKMGLPNGIIQGIAPVSGPYDMRKVGRPGELDVYVPDPSRRAEASPILDIDAPAPRAVVALGGEEEKYLSTSKELTENLRAQGVEVELLVLEGQDHAETALSLGDADSELFTAILKMIRAR